MFGGSKGWTSGQDTRHYIPRMNGKGPSFDFHSPRHISNKVSLSKADDDEDDEDEDDWTCFM